MQIPHLPKFLVYSVIGTVALMPLLVLPAMIGVLVDNADMSDSSAGWSAAINFLASAIVGVLLSLRIHRVDLRRTAMIALALALVFDIASALTAGEVFAFYLARFASGLMLGAAYVTSVSAFARLDGYERGFGLFVTLQFIVSGLGLYVVPVYADALGAVGLYTFFAVLDGIALFLARYLPAGSAGDGEAIGSSPRWSEWRVLASAAAVFGILGFAVFEAANNAQFTYIERFGVALDLPDQEIGVALLIASLIGIPGAFAIVLVGLRFGTLAPLLLGIAIAIAGLLVLSGADSFPAYFFGSCCMGFSWAFCLPFIQSMLASLDRRGSAIAAGTSLSTLGSAVGPGLAALVVGGGAYVNVFLLSVFLFILTCGAFVAADRFRRLAT